MATSATTRCLNTSFVSARADMHWLIEPRLLVVHIRSDIQRRHGFPLSAPRHPRAAAAADTVVLLRLWYICLTPRTGGAPTIASLYAIARRPGLLQSCLIDQNPRRLWRHCSRPSSARTLRSCWCPRVTLLLHGHGVQLCNSRVCARVWVNESGGRSSA